MGFDSIVNFLLGWTLKLGNFGGIVMISFIVTLLTTLVYKYFTDQEALKKIKEDNKKLQDEMKIHKDNPAKVMALQKEAFSKGFLEPMKHQLKPLLITFIPIILIFSWLGKTYGVNDVKYINFLFIHLGWLGTYIVFSIIFSMILRKMMKVY